MQHSTLAAITALIALAPTATTAAPPTTPVPTSFTIQNLEAQANDTYGGASGLNNRGEVVGVAYNKPALFVHHKVVTLPGLPAEGMAYGGVAWINDRGIGAGSVYSDETGVEHAFAFDRRRSVDLGILPGGVDSYATAINNRGEVVGFADNPATFADHAVRFAGGAAIDLGVLETDGYSYATALNDRGVAVGYASFGDGDTHAVSFVDGKIIDLTAESGGLLATANAINDQGQIAGDDSAGHAVLYENGTLTQLGGLPDAESCDVVAINNQGFATGYCPDRVGNDLPVFFAAGQVIALPTLPGTASATPAAINEACQIAGTAIFPTDNPDGAPESVAVLWTPDTDCAPRGRHP